MSKLKKLKKKNYGTTGTVYQYLPVCKMFEQFCVGYILAFLSSFCKPQRHNNKVAEKFDGRILLNALPSNTKTKKVPSI